MYFLYNYFISILVRNVKTLKLLELLHNWYCSQCYVFHESRKKPQVILFWQRNTVRCTLVETERESFQWKSIVRNVSTHHVCGVDTSWPTMQGYMVGKKMILWQSISQSNPETRLSLRQNVHDPLFLRNWARGLFPIPKTSGGREENCSLLSVCVCVCVYVWGGSVRLSPFYKLIRGIGHCANERSVSLICKRARRAWLFWYDTCQQSPKSEDFSHIQLPPWQTGRVHIWSVYLPNSFRLCRA